MSRNALALAAAAPVPPASRRRIVAAAELSTEQREAARRCFARSVFPALTPLAVGPGHPFPHVRDESLNLAVLLLPPARRRLRGAAHLLAVVQVPPALPRLVPLPPGTGEAYAMLEEVIAASVGELFPGRVVRETAAFRVTAERGGGAAVRLEIGAAASRELETALAAALKLDPSDVHRIAAPLPIPDLRALDGGRDLPR